MHVQIFHPCRKQPSYSLYLLLGGGGVIWLPKYVPNIKDIVLDKKAESPVLLRRDIKQKLSTENDTVVFAKNSSNPLSQELVLPLQQKLTS